MPLFGSHSKKIDKVRAQSFDIEAMDDVKGDEVID